jgi:hypothetical protein
VIEPKRIRGLRKLTERMVGVTRWVREVRTVHARNVPLLRISRRNTFCERVAGIRLSETKPSDLYSPPTGRSVAPFAKLVRFCLQDVLQWQE